MGMTEKLYDANSYLTEFDAAVVSCQVLKEGTQPDVDGQQAVGEAARPDAPLWEVVLDRTAFYPEGGGQPCDFGVLGGTRVIDVQEKDGIIFHLCSAPLEVGSCVHGTIDWNRRLMHMREHSGEHIISGIICHTHGYSNTGFHMGKDCVTIDFSGPLTAEQIQEAEDLANQKVLENVEILAEYPDRETLAALDYRSKKEIEGQVRIVTIEGCDSCACCGTHVAKTGEIRLIKILSAQKYKGGVRVTMLSGEKAYADYCLKHINTLGIARLLSVKPEEAGDAVVRLKQKNIEMKKEIKQLKKELYALQGAPERK